MAGPRVVRIHAIAIGLSALLAAAATATAQPRVSLSKPTRVVISVSGGVQGGGQALSEHFSFDKDQETQTVDVEYPAKAGALVDAGASVRLWKGLGLGLAVSRVTGDGSAAIEASIPHPFQFNQPRAISGTEDGIVHAETGVHKQVQYLVATSGRVHLSH